MPERVELEGVVGWFHYSVWWMRLIPRFPIMVFGSHVYSSWDRRVVVNRLSTVRHEMMHVRQYRKLGFVRFIFTYVWQWVKHGFRYTKIDLEVEAREAAKSAARPIFYGKG